MEFDAEGLKNCSRFAFPPNALEFCGPPKQKNLKAYLTENIADRGLTEIISRFETLYPYLKFIASVNHIKDPFDRRVVEAYWIGNSFLKNTKPREIYNFLNESITSKVSKKNQTVVAETAGFALPFHTYHVLNFFVRTGHHSAPHTLSTMDACRIGWGKVMKIKSDHKYFIETQPLVIINGKLKLGEKTIREVIAIGIEPQVNDLVATHWNTICSILTKLQLKELYKYTLYSLKFN
jgi:hypothetical protein